jgi:hypothetical protein
MSPRDPSQHRPLRNLLVFLLLLLVVGVGDRLLAEEPVQIGTALSIDRTACSEIEGTP